MTPQKHDYPIQGVPFTNVDVEDGFWTPRLDVNRSVTLPYCFEKCEETGRISNFAVAAGMEEGQFEGTFFNDSDVGKVLEGAAYCLALQKDPELEQYADDLIDKMVGAMEDDGYLYTARTLMREDKMPPGGAERWSDIFMGHEMYNVGHIYEAAVAYFQSTGKRKLLDAMLKNADLICSVFNPGARHDPPGHQEIEMGLAKLYRTTGDRKYLDQAKFLLDMRGKTGNRGLDGKGDLYGEYSQDHKPVVEQNEAVGHSVRAGYMYCGMADVAALTGDDEYVEAIQRIWENVIQKKMYVTGGIGSRNAGEAFGENYELPNLTAYNETCAAIANAMWNHRMFLMNGDGDHMDVIERVLFNGFLSGYALDGKHFFYPNPLGSRYGRERSPWFGCSCCPTNIVRFLPSLPGYAYASRGEDLYVGLFLAGKASVEMDGGPVEIIQTNNYPWEGGLKIELRPAEKRAFTLRVRVPGWAREIPLPGGLYSYAEPSGEAPTLKINGEPSQIVLEKGFAVLEREWRAGDTVELELPMPVRRVLCDEKVEANRGRTAVMRGPIVYCLEAQDADHGAVFNMLLPDDAALKTRRRGDVVDGVLAVEGEGVAFLRKDARDAGSEVVQEPAVFSLIPYYAWAHREKKPMLVWLAREESAVELPAPTTIASLSTVKVSDDRKPVEALFDDLTPKSSNDRETPKLHWWPRTSETEWIEYEFEGPQVVSRVEIYWFDEGPDRGVQSPKSWRLLFNHGGVLWEEVKAKTPYTIEPNKMNVVEFEPVETGSVRLEIEPPDGWSAGLYEFQVY